MRYMTFLTLLIAACASRTPPESPPPREPTAEETRRVAAELDPGTETTSMKVERSDSGAETDLLPGSPAEICEKRRRRLEDFQHELAVVEQEHAKWTESHCKRTERRDVNVRTGSTTPPTVAWICDGKLVEKPVSVRAEQIVVRMADLRDYLREKCTK